MPDQEPQTYIAAFNARIAEYVAEMDADEAEAYRRADEGQWKADKTMGGPMCPQQQYNAERFLVLALAVGLVVMTYFVARTF
jgi:hypothetical protein